MIRAMSSAVTGLGSHQEKMDVLGNNIANVNTTAFKNDQARFQDLLNQTIEGATAPLEERGGINPNQVGLGSRMASTVTDHTQGAIETTGRETDLAIEGSGYFTVYDGEAYRYSRDGSFDLDSNYEIVNSNGMTLMGWDESDVEDVDPDEDPEPIQIPIGEEMEARASENLGFAGNLDADQEGIEDVDFDEAPGNEEIAFSIDPDAGDEDEEYHYESDYHFYDSLGRRHEIVYGFAKEDVDNDETNVWHYNVGYVQYDAEGEEVEEVVNILYDDYDADEITGDETFGTLHFDGEGNLIHEDEEINDDDPETSIENIALDEGDEILNDDVDPIEGAENVRIDLNFERVSQMAETSEVRVDEHDGFEPGELEDFGIEETGAVRGTYTNGLREVQGFISLASFANPEGLSKEGGNLFDESANSGEPHLGLPGTGGRGVLQGSSLEMSNVDLSQEFTELVTTNRGFQANTRVISTSDEVLTEVVNMVM